MKDVSQFPVKKIKCSTCPFRMKNGKYRDPQLVSRLQVQMLSKGINHICHHEALEGEEATHLCCGAKDYQSEIFHRLGCLEETSDANWSEKTTK